MHFDASAVIADDLVGGMLTAELLNLSGGFISNVDLRPKVASQVGIARHVLQFGSLADGDIAVISASFHAHNGFMDDNQPTTWRLGYDQPDERLKHAAETHRRSLNSEILVCLETVLAPARHDVSELLEAARAVREKTAHCRLTTY